jgi:hypothetical protein
MPMILFWGRYGTFLPKHDAEKAFLTVVFGSPIPTKQTAEPSDAYIDEIWELYIGQIKSLYETYKNKYGYPSDDVLVIQEAKSSSSKKKE